MINRILRFTGAACALGLAGCAMNHSVAPEEKQAFGTAPDGQPVYLYTIKNSKGAEARIMNYGGIVQSLKVLDKNGNLGDVALGFANFEPYKTNSPYFGALIGRYGNRIADGKFSVDGKSYTLAQNNPPNNLHAGPNGFDKVVWNVNQKNGSTLELTYLSKDGDQGFPGNLQVSATYTLTEKNELRVEYTATTDKPTVCNLTQHSYWNLAGSGDVLNHTVQIFADNYTPVNSNLIPTGVQTVKGTPFDFTSPTLIGAHVNDVNDQLKYGGGYDHNFVLNKKAGSLGLAARVSESTSGRVLEIYTTEPGLQFYTGNFIGDTMGKMQYHNRSGFAMEAQHFPDSPNHPDFPSTELKPGQTYHNTIIYRFKTQ